MTTGRAGEYHAFSSLVPPFWGGGNSRAVLELRLINVSSSPRHSEFVVPLGWYVSRWWFIGPVHAWITWCTAADGLTRVEAGAYPPDWSKGYACWHYPVGWVTATCDADVKPWRDNARLKRVAEELTEQATADQVANALTKLNENLGYGGVWR